MHQNNHNLLGEYIGKCRLRGTQMEFTGPQPIENYAWMLQQAALETYDDELDFEGYGVTGASPFDQRILGLSRPVFAPIPRKAIFENGERLRLPQGMIGAQCELAFTFARDFPAKGQAIDAHSIADAIAGFQPAIGLLARRLKCGWSSDLAAIADCAFHHATIPGAFLDAHALTSDANIDMKAEIDGKFVLSSDTETILSGPFNAIKWLAGELAKHGEHIQPGDLVATGSCMPILQVLPGQTLKVVFGELGSVECGFD